MPIQECEVDGQPGFQYGPEGKCYLYAAGDDAQRREARRQAYMQGIAIEKRRGGEVHE